MIVVTFQHPTPYFDDSYAVNSVNVGPYGDAIIRELIPEVEKRYRIIKEPYARVLSGGSTGGWESLALQIFHPDFTFRGSLGPELVGHEQFIGYVSFVTGALDRYTSDILALGEEGKQVFGKLRFHGYHRKELFEVQPTGRHVWWYGAPIFTFEGDLVRDLWVLGDIHGLIARLKGPPAMSGAA